MSMLAYSPDGKFIASVVNSSFCVYTESGNVVYTITQNCHSVEWSQDGRYIAIDARQIWEVASSKMVQVRRLHDDERDRNEYWLGMLEKHNPLHGQRGPWSNQFLLAFARESGAYVWDTQDNTIVKFNQAANVHDTAWSKSKNMLAVASGLSVNIVDMKRKQVVQVLKHPCCSHTMMPEYVRLVRWAPDGFIATVSTDGELRVWNLNGDIVQVYTSPSPVTNCRPHDEPGYVLDLAWAPNGVHLAIVTNDGVRVWNAKQDKVVRTILSDKASSVTWSPDGHKLAYTEGYERRLRICADPLGRDFSSLLSHLFSP